MVKTHRHAEAHEVHGQHARVLRRKGNERSKQVFPTVYLQKHNFMPSSAPPPDTIELTLTWGDKP
jgi:hypothetical protein